MWPFHNWGFAHWRWTPSAGLGRWSDTRWGSGGHLPGVGPTRQVARPWSRIGMLGPTNLTIYIAQPRLIGVRGPLRNIQENKYVPNPGPPYFRICAFLRKMNRLNMFLINSLCQKGIKTHYATFCNRILPHILFWNHLFCICIKYFVQIHTNSPNVIVFPN